MRSFRVRSGTVNLDERRVQLGTHTHHLTPLEARLLARLADSSPEPVARDVLLRDVWDYRSDLETQVLEQAVRRVRRKIEVQPSAPCHLLTEHGHGYRLLVAAEPTARSVQRPRNRFVGRAAELAAMDAWYEQGATALLSLVGLGGIGKTRLVLEWTHRAALRCSVWVVELSHCATEHEAIERALDTVGARGTDLQPTIDDLVGALQEHTGLLVLDNAERLVAEIADWAQQIAERVPSMRLVATTREPLHVPVEQVVRVGPLQPADAIALWRARAPSATAIPDDELGQQTDLIDRIPLAIELASAFAVRMDARALLGTRRRRAVTPRHETLEACLAESWDRLDADQRRSLAAACVFRGGLSRHALGAVTGFDPAPVLQDLVDASLVRVIDPTEPRFDVFQLVRAFVEAREDLAPARRAHARLFAEHGDPEALRALGRDPELPSQRQRDADNLVAALRFTVDEHLADDAARCVLALCTLWARTQPAAALRWVRTVSSLPHGPETCRILGLFEGALCTLTGRLDEASALLERHLEGSESDPSLRGRILIELGNVAWTREALQRAAEHYEAAADALRHADDLWFLANAIDNLGAVLVRQGRFQDALAQHEQAMRLHERTGNRAAAAATASNLAAAAHLEGDAVRAHLMYERAAQEAKAFAYHNTRVDALTGLAGVLVHQGQLDDAIAPAHEAYLLASQLRSPRLEAKAAAALAEVYVYREETEPAAILLAEAQVLAGRADAPFFRGRVSGLVAEHALRQGELARARAELQTAETQFRHNDQVLALTITLGRRGLVEARAGRLDQAAEWLERATETHARRGEPRHPAVVGVLRTLEGHLAPHDQGTS
ncbi:MAG: tetratricopeptide repeat protein [Myxococcales bacterium]|nr:tetratricopeptide repeat protein [Myxococcales bacterium]